MLRLREREYAGRLEAELDKYVRNSYKSGIKKQA